MFFSFNLNMSSWEVINIKEQHKLHPKQFLGCKLVLNFLHFDQKSQVKHIILGELHYFRIIFLSLKSHSLQGSKQSCK